MSGLKDSNFPTSRLKAFLEFLCFKYTLNVSSKKLGKLPKILNNFRGTLNTSEELEKTIVNAAEFWNTFQIFLHI